MSKVKKMIERIKNNPGTVRFDVLDNLMLRFGFESRQFGTSHVTYSKGDKRVIVVKPHGGDKCVKPVYVRKCLDALEGEKDDEDEN